MKRLVATVITHELAHQWFGDLVTMKWWDDLWLNESFANMMEYVAVDAIHPEWKIWELFQTSEAPIALQREIGDGKIFVAELQRVIRIRTGEADEAAL